MKKITTGIILALVLGAVVYGAAHRTQALYGKSSGNTSQSALTGVTVDIDNEEKDLITLEAVVETVGNDLWVLSLNNSSAIEIEGRTLDLIISSNFIANVGTHLSLVGFYETPDSFEISKLINLETGEVLIVRDDTGKPVWGKGGGVH